MFVCLFSLKSVSSDRNMATPTFLWIPLAWSIDFLLLSLFVLVAEMCLWAAAYG